MTTITITASEIRDLGTPPRWRRTDPNAPDVAAEIVSIVQTEGAYFCAELDRDTPYLVQITTEAGDLVGLYDLDGDQIDAATVGEWELPREAGGLPSDVYEHVATLWESGTSTMVRIHD